MNLFAMQILVSEGNWAAVVQSFLTKADSLGFKCKSVEAVDSMTIGSFPYLRLKTDLDIEGLTKVVEALHADSRGVIMPPGPQGYECRLKGGKKGVVALSKMHVTPRGESRSFQGNATKNWKAQFAA